VDGAIAKFEEALALDPSLDIESQAEAQRISAGVLPVPPGETVTGTVESGAIDYWRLELAAESAVIIDLVADYSFLDAYLNLFAADGALIAENDDFNFQDLNSRIEITLSAGRYLIGAAGSGNSSGAYRLAVVVAEEAP
jgi:hypothetical protein